MSTQLPTDLETDSRFPSGPWTGYFLQKQPIAGRHQMELVLTFGSDRMTGEGRDRVGAFVIEGVYSLQNGECRWTKRYVGQHEVYYKGFNEGKGIWGTWEIPPFLRGGFHIWPEGMPDPNSSHLSEEAELPVPELEPVGT